MPMSKAQNPKQEQQGGIRVQTDLNMGNLDFEFVSDFELRVSDF